MFGNISAGLITTKRISKLSPDSECMVQEAKYAADAEIERLNRALQEAIKGQEDATMDKFGDPLSGSKASTNVSELPDSVSNKRCC